MAVVRKVDQSTDRKLQILKSQLYGKDRQQQKQESLSPVPNLSSLQPKNSSDTAYLKRDLLRILILSALAIGAQLGLFLANKSSLIKI